MEKLDHVGLASRGRDKVRAYSQGMKQRMGIAVAMVHDPALVILDEPTNGLDPQGIADIRNLIRSLSQDQGKTVIVSSHLLAEIEQVATRLLIIDKGRKVAEGPIRDLLDPEHVSLEVDTTDNNACIEYLCGTPWRAVAERTASGRIRLSMEAVKVPDFTRELVERGFGVRALDPQNALEAYFLSLTQPNGHVEPGQDRTV
jgi:ABC-type multidrug transport system ATPase subunit